MLVTSYNSAQTIKETLNSVYKQTYEKIELVISDDSSADETRFMAKEWAKTYGCRFERVKIVKTEKNSGISYNFNYGMKFVTGEWVGVIAADDILLPNYVADNVKQVIKQKSNSILFSKFIPFRTEINGKKIYWRQDEEEVRYIKKVAGKNPSKQFDMIIRREILCSPTLFVNKECFEQVGGCDLRIRNIDDWPLKMKISKCGYKICFFSKPTLLYRIGNSTSHTDEYILNANHIKQIKLVKKLWCYPNIKKYEIFYYYQEMVINLKNFIVIQLFKNKNTKAVQIINLVFNCLLPTKWKKIPYRIIN